ncbi:MAG: chromate transporter [Firmicutes bacterium]|nr:chromate transporter [Bacillota bacterium]
MYILLFYEFFKTGLFAIGGGLATIPFLYDMATRHPEWFDASTIVDMLAVSECTPGPIGINMSTYVGFKTGFIPGAFTSTFGLVIPSVIVVLAVSKILAKFKENKYVQRGFYGIRPASVGLIAAAGIMAIGSCFINLKNKGLDIINFKALILALVLFVLMKKFKNIHPVAFIALSAVAGCIFGF